MTRRCGSPSVLAVAWPQPREPEEVRWIQQVQAWTAEPRWQRARGVAQRLAETDRNCVEVPAATREQGAHAPHSVLTKPLELRCSAKQRLGCGH